MSRPVTTLTSKESKLLSGIPSAKKASAIWSRFTERKLQAKSDRLALGKELISVRNALATKGCKGLFTRWLCVNRMPHDRAYGYIALAGGGKPRTESPSHKRKLTLIGFVSKFRSADTNAKKIAVLNSINTYLVREFKIAASVSISEKK